jgi:transposase
MGKFHHETNNRERVMIGVEGPNNAKLFYHFSLEKKVRKNHPLRRLKETLNLDFMYGLLKDKYGYNGNVSVPPPVIMKMMILLFLYNVRSEREMMETIPERLDWLWFLGYDIDEDVPNHSVLSKARKRWGEDIFKELFGRVVKQAVGSGLVDGEKIFVDASLVEADASKNSVKKLVDIKLDEKYRELVKRLDERGEDGIGEYGKINRQHISSTDPDATITHQNGTRNLSYKVHRSVDDRKEIITSCSVTTGAVNEAHVLEKTIAEHEDTVGKNARTVVADSKYGTNENYCVLKEKNITTHIKDLGATRAIHADVFGKDKFEYVAERDVYICQAGKELQRRSWNRNRGWMKYRIEKEQCASCEFKSQCTNDKNGRSVSRLPGDDLIVAGRQDANSEEGIKDLKRRQHLMERSYAYGKRFGYKRARWRSLWRVSIQQLLVATVQNLLKMTKHESPVGHLCSNFFNWCCRYLNVFNFYLTQGS